MSKNTKVLQLTRELIGLKTDPTNFDELRKSLELIESVLSEFTIDKFESEGYTSLLIHNREKGNKHFHLILNGHLDVIPSPQIEYKSRIEGNRLYGIGSMDMKSSLATMVYVFKAIAKKINFPMALQVVTDEELGGFYGTKYQISQGVRSDFVISGESTNFNIVNKTKGIIWIRIKCSGISAHGAYPWLGDNAILKANRVIEKLFRLYPIPESKEKNIWVSSINLSNIETNNKSFNKVPSECTISLDVRYIPKDKDEVMTNIKDAVGDDGEIEIIVNEPFIDVSEKNEFILTLQDSTCKILGRSPDLYGAMGSSDARHYTLVGIPAVEFGPIGGSIGSEDEWVDIDSLQQFYDVLVEFILKLDRKYLV
ncbi:M20 family peptidase [Candidatus Dojkabacteria bacterium]|uniref:M20 family peptidase n=1 Tax=Candidatus Dojkabacteria bacterium TaxID=2099670 RepID=A0A3M0YZH6_9BACT|nr:MAG: M20 family peptidase [Candidatus Dojkabacteria bacterium]